jgi:hypothetical protein
MTLVARIRHLSLVLVAVGALVAPVLAGERIAPGGTDETQVKGRSIPPAAETGSCSATTPSAAARTPRTSINPTDDGYAPKPARTSGTAAAHPAELSPATAAPPAPASTPPARKRESATSVSRAPRPAAQRAKVSMRNLPATPGMGTLLRVGVSAGREISFLDFTLPSAPRTAHSGRAPPLGRAISHPAPAALPGAPPTAANNASAHLSAAPHRSTESTTTTTEPNPPRRAPRDFRACAHRLAARPSPRLQAPFPHTGPGAGRSESTPASGSPRLSGGFTT